MKIAIINFSNRTNGNSLDISKYLKDLYIGNDVKLYNFSSLNIEACGSCAYECLKKGYRCPKKDKINKMYHTICNADMCYYVLPNYCDYPCSNFFLFNERSCGYFNNNYQKMDKYLNVKKKFIVITNSNTENFIEILKKHVKNENPEILFISTKKFGLLSASDRVLTINSSKVLIEDFVNDNYHLEESAMGVVLCNDKILATKEEIYGNLMFSLPKGHVEKNETYIETAIREVNEETGVELNSKDFYLALEPYEIKFIDHYHRLIKKKIYPLLFKINEEKPFHINEKRVKEINYYNVYEFIKNCSYENIKNIILDALTK